MTAIIDYGAGNLFSLKSSFEYIGEKITVTADPAEISRADRIVLPGVGAFSAAAEKLGALGLDRVILDDVKRGKKLLGICLGMQLLFERSYEYGEHMGLGLISGSVKPISDFLCPEYKNPHIGWNALEFTVPKSELFKYNKDGDFVYFVHSYFGADCEKSIIARTEYGIKLCAAVACGNVYGVQFHPEKSHKAGLSMLRAFCEMK